VRHDFQVRADREIWQYLQEKTALIVMTTQYSTGELPAQDRRDMTRVLKSKLLLHASWPQRQHHVYNLIRIQNSNQVDVKLIGRPRKIDDNHLYNW
jgi:hypothetical protein